ncbi:ubiquitin thioesterase trabid [Anastrepha ludens]|uniref:ubiquitin thioesterase trabid n=1 Tax=Anastrepha ludens TaxID=28586 RepID=UPI0023AF0F91|nr:ubiquitin thioesterase trabid [Anastrepha ludens]XP_053946234.1 ubiquitin thioesterase trabid [Anastrepha ludens]
MCDSDASKVQKWTCDYCTYENFPSSLKCTMCKGTKPLLNEDIFRLSPPQTAFDGDEERGATADVVEASSLNACYAQSRQDVPSTLPATASPSGCAKWACKMCTYLNWPRSLRCVQCCTKRGTTVDVNVDQQVCNSGEAAAVSLTSSGNLDAIEGPQGYMDKRSKTGEGSETTVTANITNPNTISSNNIKDQLKALRITNDMELNSSNIAEAQRNEASSHTSQINRKSSNSYIQSIGAASNRLSPFEQSSTTNMITATTNTTVNTTHLNNLANTSQQHQQQQQHNQSSTPLQNCYVSKWACNTCTYENWPKSLKCSMCGDPRDGNATSIASLGDSNAITATSGSCSNKFLNVKDENHDMTVSTNNTFNKKHIYQLGSSETINNCDTVQERQERRQRQIRRQVDWQWLNACLGVVENNYSAVEAYLSCGGNPARALTATEIAILNRNSAFDVGHTLIHLAIRFHREEMLPMLLAQISGSGPGIKRVPSYVAPDLAADIRRHFANTLRMRKTSFNCFYVQEHATFALPAEIEELPIQIQEQLYDELLDRDAQKQLENPPPALNWSLEITARLGSRLLVLWNRSAGDCLLDSAMQATWGVFDRDNTLRRALADTLHQCGPIFYPRWKEYEKWQASMLHFTLEDAQWQDDWSNLLSLASQPGSSLEQLHIFALAHILRRPIIVYGVKYVKSFRGEDIGYARFEGLYLPLFWDQNFCIKSPIALGYTRGHFSALVPMEPFARIDPRRDEPEDVRYLPLMDCESKLLPIHFLTQAEMGREEAIMRQWLDVCVTDGGLLVAQQKLRKRPLLVAQMLEEWLNHYRRIAQVITAPFVRRPQQTGYSSEGDSDEE